MVVTYISGVSDKDSFLSGMLGTLQCGLIVPTEVVESIVYAIVNKDKMDYQKGKHDGTYAVGAVIALPITIVATPIAIVLSPFVGIGNIIRHRIIPMPQNESERPRIM